MYQAIQVANAHFPLYLLTTNEPDLSTNNNESDHANKRRIVTKPCRLTGYDKGDPHQIACVCYICSLELRG